MAENIYRVEKDGRSFHVQPEALDYYASQGYRVFKQVEEPVYNIDKELKVVRINDKDEV